MNKKPNVNLTYSVVIPLFNKEEYIIRCIDSIFKQTYWPQEIIIVDDGSTDKGISLIRKKFKQPIIKIISQANSGVSKARNRGIKESQSNFVALIDADDEYTENFSKTMDQLIRDYPEEGMYGFGYTRFGQKNTAGRYRGKTDYLKLYNEYNLSPHSASSVVINKNQIDFDIFPENCGMGEDLYAWLKIISFGHTFIFDSTVCAIYHHDDPNSAVLKLTAKEEPFFLIEKSIFNCLNESDVMHFIDFHSRDYIKSQVLFGSRTHCFSWILKAKKLKYFCYLPLLLFPKNVILFIHKRLKKS